MTTASATKTQATPNWRLLPFAVGAVLYMVIAYRFQTYQQRNDASLDYLALAVAMLVAGLALALVAKQHFARVSTFLTLGVLAAHIVIIFVDTYEDPTNHNLFPFELIMFALISSPAYLGAGIAKLIGKLGR
ncbi:MAG: hypothetical protein ABI811_01130 [Acidobacteriota bacterium]